MNKSHIFLSIFCCTSLFDCMSMENEEEIEIEVEHQKSIEDSKPSFLDLDIDYFSEDESCASLCFEFCFPSEPMDFLRGYFQYRAVSKS